MASGLCVRASALGTRTRARTDVDKQVEAGTAPHRTAGFGTGWKGPVLLECWSVPARQTAAPCTSEQTGVPPPPHGNDAPLHPSRRPRPDYCVVQPLSQKIIEPFTFNQISSK